MDWLAVSWRGDEYDLSTWQGWAMLLVGLLVWTAVSASVRGGKGSQKAEKTEGGEQD